MRLLGSKTTQDIPPVLGNLCLGRSFLGRQSMPFSKRRVETNGQWLPPSSLGTFFSNCVVRFDLWPSDLERGDHWPPFWCASWWGKKEKTTYGLPPSMSTFQTKDDFNENPVIPLRKQHVTEDRESKPPSLHGIQRAFYAARYELQPLIRRNRSTASVGHATLGLFASNCVDQFGLWLSDLERQDRGHLLVCMLVEPKG